jgi:DNA-binding XRE family transcriptional regulator
MGIMKEFVGDMEQYAIKYGESISSEEFYQFTETILSKISKRRLRDDDIDDIFCDIHKKNWKKEGEVLLERRENLELSQEDVSEGNGISIQTLDRIERGKPIADRNSAISPLMFFYVIKEDQQYERRYE